VEVAPNGLALDREERARSRTTLEGIDFSRGGRGSRARG
jgi:DNA primase